MNYHTLSDFRSDSEEQFADVIVQIVSSLMSQGLVSLTRVAQDGMKMRASAGKSSFRRRETLLPAITHDLMHGLRLQTQAAGERLRLVAAGVVEQSADG